MRYARLEKCKRYVTHGAGGGKTSALRTPHFLVKWEMSTFFGGLETRGVRFGGLYPAAAAMPRRRALSVRITTHVEKYQRDTIPMLHSRATICPADGFTGSARISSLLLFPLVDFALSELSNGCLRVFRCKQARPIEPNVVLFEGVFFVHTC